MIRAWVQIAPGEAVDAQDYLAHSEGGAKPQRGPLAAVGAFALVLDPTPADRAPDGSYRVKCELIIARPYLSRQSEGMHHAR